MGLLRITNNYGYRNDTQKPAGTSFSKKVSNPILHFAMNENPTPNVEEQDETPIPTAEQVPAASDETPTEAAPAAGESEETSDEPLTKPAAENSEETSGENKNGTTYVFVEWQKLKEKYKAINALPTDKERIIKWHQETAGINPKPYVIVDKASCEATVYSATGEVIDTYLIGISREKGDEIQLENVVIKNDGKKITIDKAKDSNGKTFETTSAGIYYFSGKAKVSPKKGNTYPTIDGYNEYSLESERGSTGVSINPIPSNHPEQIGKMYNGKTQDNRFTDGDINLYSKDFQKLGKHLKFGTEVFVLPEDSNNKIIVRDGQLNLVQEKFTGTVSTSKKPTVVHPIEVQFKTEAHNTKTMQEFAKGLEDKKADLMEKLNIDNDTYNDLASLALGIAGQESKFGESRKYQFKENHPTVTSILKWIFAIPNNVKGCVSSSPSSVKQKSKCTEGCNSRGILQMKLGEYTDPEVIRLLAEYGITKKNPDVLNDPKNSAIAGMIVLTNMHKNEVPGIKRIRSKMNRKDISDLDAITYMWHGRKDQLLDKKKDVNPDTNTYRESVRKFLEKNFILKEVVEAPKIQ